MRIVLSFIALATVILVGCQSPNGTNPTTQPTPIIGNGPTNNEAYNVTWFALQNAELIANQLAAASVLPQADVTLAESLANAAMRNWLNNINGTTVSVTIDANGDTPETKARDAVNKVQALVVTGQREQNLKRPNTTR